MGWRDRIKHDETPAPEQAPAATSSWRDRIKHDDVPAELVTEEPQKLPRDELPKALTLGEEVDALRDFAGSVSEKVPFAAAAEKAGAALGSAVSDKTYPELLKRIQEINANKQAERDQRSPAASTLGKGYGMLAGPVGAKGISAAGEVLPGAATGVKAALQRILTNMGLAGTDRATQEDTLENAAVEGAKAAGLAGVLSTAGELAPLAGQSVKGFANRRAVKALDPTLAQQQVLQNKGAVDALGNTLLDEGVVKFGSNVESMAPRLEEMLAEKGQRIGDIREAADNALGRPSVDMSRLQNKGNAMEAFTDASIDAEQAMAGAYQRNASNLAKVPNRTIGETQEVLSGINHQLDFNKPFGELTPDQQALMTLRRDLVGQVDDRIAEGVPHLAGEHKALKDQFGLFKEGDKILDKSVARSGRNADVGLRDLLVGNIGKNGGGIAGSVKGMAATAASKMARERGNAAIAVSADKVAQLLQGKPEALGKWAAPLMQALNRSPKAFLATHALMMRDPEYAAMFDETEPAK